MSRRRAAPPRRTQRQAAPACHRGRPWGPPARRGCNRRHGRPAGTRGARSPAACRTRGCTAAPAAKGVGAPIPQPRLTPSRLWPRKRHSSRHVAGCAARAARAAGRAAPTWKTPFWLQGSCLASAPQRHATVDTSAQGGHSPSWQAAGQACPQGSAAPHTPPQLNSCRPHRLSVTTAPQKQEAETTRGQGGQGPAARRAGSGQLAFWQMGRCTGTGRDEQQLASPHASQPGRQMRLAGQRGMARSTGVARLAGWLVAGRTWMAQQHAWVAAARSGLVAQLAAAAAGE